MITIFDHHWAPDSPFSYVTHQLLLYCQHLRSSFADSAVSLLIKCVRAKGNKQTNHSRVKDEKSKKSWLSWRWGANKCWFSRLQFDFADKAYFVLTKCGRAKEEEKTNKPQARSKSQQMGKIKQSLVFICWQHLCTKIKINIRISQIEIDKLNEHRYTS